MRTEAEQFVASLRKEIGRLCGIALSIEREFGMRETPPPAPEASEPAAAAPGPARRSPAVVAAPSRPRTGHPAKAGGIKGEVLAIIAKRSGRFTAAEIRDSIEEHRKVIADKPDRVAQILCGLVNCCWLDRDRQPGQLPTYGKTNRFGLFGEQTVKEKEYAAFRAAIKTPEPAE